MNKRLLSPIVLLVLLSCTSSAASGNSTDEAPPQRQSLTGETILGSDQAMTLGRVETYMQQKQFNEAGALLDDIIIKFEVMTADQSKQYLCFVDDTQYHRYLDDINGDRQKNLRPIVRLHNSYAKALHYKGWLAAENGNWNDAIALFNGEVACSPFDPRPHIEKGYALNRIGEPRIAYDTYKIAYELAVKYETSKKLSATALRGMGSAMIELGELDQATKLFERSLRLDPENKTALNELQYIDIQKFALQGTAEDQCAVGLAYATGSEGDPKVLDEAVKWFRMAADRGLPEAQFYMGVSCREGWGTMKDVAEAERWMQKACKNGFTRACDQLHQIDKPERVE